MTNNCHIVSRSGPLASSVNDIPDRPLDIDIGVCREPEWGFPSVTRGVLVRMRWLRLPCSLLPVYQLTVVDGSEEGEVVEAKQ